tara:strand:+ start:199 stop:414 length:216 start_codon:yes stop_codon:yes gene_type:complete
MKDFKIKLEGYTSNVLAWTVFLAATGLMIVNIVTMLNMYSVIETMWHEMVQIKETNGYLYQFIEEHRNDFN